METERLGCEPLRLGKAFWALASIGPCLVLIGFCAGRMGADIWGYGLVGAGFIFACANGAAWMAASKRRHRAAMDEIRRRYGGRA